MKEPLLPFLSMAVLNKGKSNEAVVEESGESEHVNVTNILDNLTVKKDSLVKESDLLNVTKSLDNITEKKDSPVQESSSWK